MNKANMQRTATLPQELQMRGRIASPSDRIQSGVALITVLMVCFVATFLVVSMIERQDRDIQRSANLLANLQLMQNAMSAEEFAMELLSNDFHLDEEKYSVDNADGIRDSLVEEWNGKKHMDFSEGYADISITDAQSRFNLNNLLTTEGASEINQGALLQLFDALNISNAVAVLGKLNEYFIAGTPLTTLGQFQQISGMSDEDFTRLKSCAVVLPPQAALNLNTASELILTAWDDVIALNQREDMLIERERNNGLNLLPSIAGNFLSFGLVTEYFEVNITAAHNERMLKMRSLIFRNRRTGRMTTVSRVVENYFFASREPFNPLCQSS
jgi:general secretion pathway protein K